MQKSENFKEYKRFIYKMLSELEPSDIEFYRPIRIYSYIQDECCMKIIINIIKSVLNWGIFFY